jgi:thiol-disulfide isomerase/thioredoxin
LHWPFVPNSARKPSTGIALFGLMVFLSASLSSSAEAAQPEVVGASTRTLLQAVKKPGARAVLLNVWASWCEPCRAEMADVLRFVRAHRRAGLRLVLVSADDESDRESVVRFLAKQGVDFPTWLKRGDDMEFINSIDAEWSGTLPASFLFDGQGRVHRKWYGEVTLQELDTAWHRLVSRRKETAP